MNIYFSCSITGGRQDQQVYQVMVETMLAAGHQVPTALLSSADILTLEDRSSAADVYRRDVAWVRGCDVLVAEVSTPSHGVGYEIALALALGKPVLCCYQQGRRVSKMLLGNDSPGLRLAAYDDPQEAAAAVMAFLSGVAAER